MLLKLEEVEVDLEFEWTTIVAMLAMIVLMVCCALVFLSWFMRKRRQD